MIFYLGKVRQYRLIRAHVNFGTDSRFYPYDTQMPILKLRSLDYGNNEIILTTKILNNLNQVHPQKNEVNDITDLGLIQDGFCIPIKCCILQALTNRFRQTVSRNSNGNTLFGAYFDFRPYGTIYGLYMGIIKKKIENFFYDPLNVY